MNEIKKVVCPNCEALLEVEDDGLEESIKCPNCGTNFNIEMGENALERLYKRYKSKGFKFYTKLKFVESNECYKNALELHKDDFDLHTKYLLNLMYQNTFLNTNFHMVEEYFENLDVTLDANNTYLFLAFCTDYLQNIYIYFREVESRIIVDGLFINEIYIKPYFKAIKDINSSLKYLKGIFPLLKEEEMNNYINDTPSLNERFNEFLSKSEFLLNNKHNLINKSDFEFNLESEEITYLNESIKEGKESKLDDDRVIVPSKKFQKEMRIFYTVCAILLVVALVMLIVGLMTNINLIAYLALIPLAAAIIYFIVIYKKNE